MRLVIVESPYAGNIDENVSYAKQAVLDCLKREEAPIASHLLFTQSGLLDDNDVKQRNSGIQAGHAWIHAADAVVCYIDNGISSGMRQAITVAQLYGIPIEYRKLTKT